jgi:uncharacterized protein YecT (DUF1311 family)
MARSSKKGVAHMSQCVRQTLPALALTLFAQVVFAQTSKAAGNGIEHACDWAQSQMELNQCSGEQYHKADQRLNIVYNNALRLMQSDLSDAQQQGDADDVKFNRAAIEKLKAAEKAWIQYRDLHCDAARHEVGGGSMSPMIWGFCMAKTTGDRIEELKQAYETGNRKLE